MGIVWGGAPEVTGDDRYLTGMLRANEFLRKIQWMGTGNPDLDGGISGSFPLHGQYGRFQILNWAVEVLRRLHVVKPPLPQIGTNPKHFARNPGFRQAIMLICA